MLKPGKENAGISGDGWMLGRFALEGIEVGCQEIHEALQEARIFRSWFLLLSCHQRALEQDEDKMPFSDEMVNHVVPYSVLLEQYPVPWCQPSLRPCFTLLCSRWKERWDQAPRGSGTAHGWPMPQERRAAPRHASPLENRELSSPQITRTASAHRWQITRSLREENNHSDWKQSVMAFWRDKFPRPFSRLLGDAPALSATPSRVRSSQALRVGLNPLWENSECRAQRDAIFPEPEPGLCFMRDVVFPAGGRGQEGDASPAPIAPRG